MIWARALTGPSGSDLRYCRPCSSASAEPVVLDRLVEEGGVGLVAIVGLGVLPQVLRQLADEGPVVPGLDLGDAGRERARPTCTAGDERHRSQHSNGATRSWISRHQSSIGKDEVSGASRSDDRELTAQLR